MPSTTVAFLFFVEIFFHNPDITAVNQALDSYRGIAIGAGAKQWTAYNCLK
jgi:hypothetical protein